MELDNLILKVSWTPAVRPSKHPSGKSALNFPFLRCPKLKNFLRRPSIEEIGSRATIFDLEGSGGEKRKFFVASLAEIAQRVQRAANHHRAHLLKRLVW
jgi:hypothetical protein